MTIAVGGVDIDVRLFVNLKMFIKENRMLVFHMSIGRQEVVGF